MGRIGNVRIRLNLLLIAIIAHALLMSGSVPLHAQPGGNDRFPLRSPKQLSPPCVQSPIYECARAVAVYGFVPGATVDVYANGVEHIGQITAPATWINVPERQVMLNRPLKINDVVSATQTYNGLTSEPSFQPVKVVAPLAMTKPVVDRELWECGQIVNVHNLRPSTHVEVRDLDAMPPDAVIGTGESTGEDLAVVTSKLVVNHRIVAVQIRCPAMPDEAKSPQSDPQRVSSAPTPQPPILDAPIPGSHTISFHHLFVGAALEAKLGGAVIAAGLATAHDNWAPVDPALPGSIPSGQPTATQTLCVSSPPGVSPPPATTLPAPVLGAPICEGSHYVHVWNVLPGATVILVRAGAGIGYGSGAIVPGGGGFHLNTGDDLMVVQQVGLLTSPPSNHVMAGCGSAGNVTTQHNDNNRAGVYPFETTLTAAQVLAHGMTLKYKFPVANQSSINAQPLYVRRVPFANGGANGLFICDTRNNVYGVDADTGQQKWKVTLADSDPQARPNPTNIDTTPVIDVANHRLYVTFSANNNQPLSANPADEAGLAARLQSAFWLVALDYTTGAEVARTKIAASLYRNDGTPCVFDARFQRNHAALLLDHGSIYVAFCSIAPAEWTEFHGWVMAYRASDLGLAGAWCASKNFTGTNPYDGSTYKTQGGSGIWEGGGGLSADPDGNIYFLTGNGEADVAHDKYGDCLVKLTPTGSGLIAQTFVPTDATQMFLGDADAGAGGTVTIPGTNLVVGGGKTGYMWLLDRAAMTPVQSPITAATSQYPDDNADSWRYASWYTGPHLHGSPTYWRGPDPQYGYFYVWSEKDYLRQYRFDTASGKIIEPAFRKGPILASDSPPPGNVVVMPGGIASLSANNNAKGSGVLWATLPRNDTPGPGTPSISAHLYAFNAETLKLLWNTTLPSLGHWLPPTIADGKVFIGTGSDMLLAYQLGEGRNASPRALSPTPAPGRPRMRDNRMVEPEERMMFLPARLFKTLAPQEGYEQIGVVEGDGTVGYENGARPPEAPTWRQVTASVRGSFTEHRALEPVKGRIALTPVAQSKLDSVRWQCGLGRTGANGSRPGRQRCRMGAVPCHKCIGPGSFVPRRLRVAGIHQGRRDADGCAAAGPHENLGALPYADHSLQAAVTRR